MELKSILILKGKSTYDSTIRFLNEMHQEWEKMGLDVAELSIYNELQYRKIRQEILSGRQFDVVLSFNGMMLENELMQNLLQNSKPVYCTMLMDHPMHHHDRLISSYSKIFVLSPDYRHVEYLEKYYPNIWAEAFLPHGGCEAKNIRPYRDREILISFIGSYFDSQKKKREYASLGKNVQVVLDILSKYMIGHTEVTIEMALEGLLKSNHIKLQPTEFAAYLSQLKMADSYIRGYYREKVIQKLLDSKIPVDVYGKGWEEFQCSNKEYLHIHPPCDFKKSLEITANSKFSLNVMPWFKAGSHDRVFTAMACGAVSLSDTSEYLEELELDNGIVLYDLNQIDKLPDIIHYYMEHEEEAEKIAALGRENFCQKHTWGHRAREVILYLTELSQLEEEKNELDRILCLGREVIAYLNHLSQKGGVVHLKKGYQIWLDIEKRMKEIAPEEEKNIYIQLFEESESMLDIYGRLCIQDLLYQKIGKGIYTDWYLNNIRNLLRGSVDTQYFLYWQMRTSLFSRQEKEDCSTDTGELFRCLYREMYQKLQAKLETMQEISLEERDNTLVIVTTGQMRGLLHAPTKTALDRCYTLITKWHKQVLLIDTTEVCTQEGMIPLFYSSVAGHYYLKEMWNELEYKGVRIPVYQMEEKLSLKERCRKLRDIILEKKPLFLLNIGGNSLVTDICSAIVPEFSVATVFSDLSNTEGQYQMIGHSLTEREKEFLKRFGQSEEQVVEGLFTFSLVEKTHDYTRKELGFPEGRFLIAMIGGRLTGEVKQDFMESLLPYVKMGAYFVFMGKMDQYEEFAEIMPEFGENSSYLGIVKDVLAVLDVCDIYINPKRRGGGSSAVEAMYMGVPVLSYNHGDVFVNAGQEFCVETEEEFFNTLERYMTDAVFYQEQSDKARARAAVLMDSHHGFGEALEEFYCRAGIPKEYYYS